MGERFSHVLQRGNILQSLIKVSEGTCNMLHGIVKKMLKL